ncbi:hypothetical protein [Microbacterium profundi]
MTNQRNSHRYRRSPDRRVWVFSELNRDLRPEHLAKIITAAGLEQARLEAEARAEQEAGDRVEDGPSSSVAHDGGGQHG